MKPGTPRLNEKEIALAVRRLSKDNVFARVAKRFPQPTLTHSNNAFRALVRAIIHQQLSTKAAATIEGRFVALYRPKKFPKPEDMANTNITAFRAVGLSGQKSNYLQDLARKFIDKTVDPKHFHVMSDEEIRAHVISVKGIAKWSADMFLIFALNRRNVLPTGDLAIQKGAQIFFALKTLPTPERIEKLAKSFKGDYTVFSLYLWKLADEAKQLKKK